ncbi:MAG TPA: 3-isopropylmalate dehydratase small subunit [Xylella sp.]
MEKFTTVKGYAAPMPLSNINTDMITPKYMLKWVTKTGLSWSLFREYRIRDDGSENPDFILNQEPWRKAKLIVALENFGCCSSREHALWALYDFGIRSVIETSFADIFYNNCFKNGLLPVTLKPNEITQVMEKATAGRQVAVDLLAQKVILENNCQFEFEVTEFREYCLLNGLDDIGLTLEQVPKIEQFEQLQRTQQPWLYDRVPLN